ncbi:hypothetical protein AYO38_11095 [bacterium SCGC AG-212-C10]|nr:hypothetical protein AYO38_11095 [bacterium SCGC AG-212-C10]
MPRPTALTQPFWDATKEGRLVMQRCTTCATFVWTPQMACRECLTETLEWTDVTGRGHIYTFVVMHHAAIPAFKAPYTIAVVELEEGPRIFTDIIDIDPDDVKIDMAVEVAFEDAGPVGLYHFRPRK